MKIAVLSGSTTSEIVEALELFLLDYGISPVFHIGDYGNYWQNAMFPPEDFLEFNPDIIYIHTTLRNIPEFPKPCMNTAETEALLSDRFLHFKTMWDNLQSLFGCTIIQNNLELPYYRMFGNRDFYDRRGRINFVNRLNLLFSEYAENNSKFLINDINFLSANYGLEKWSDPSYWNLYKLALSTSAIPEFSFNIANIIKAVYGKNKKALAVDLDNTLWGGIIGDDGAGGIKLGQDLSVGQAYSEFQEYIKFYKDLGVFLAVNSKNDIQNALQGLNHPDAVLTPADFAVIKANWNKKSDNILDIASALNIFPDSVVFLDDNPAEREEVRLSVSGVETPELVSIENYIRVIDRNAYFELISLSEDDLKRNEMMKQNVERYAGVSAFKNYDEFLKSLNMTAKITPFRKIDFQRIVQLINKSNQFNLTTRRYSPLEVESVASDGEYITLCGRLSDKFGDNGIVSLIIGKISGAELHIELWLMSCRVLKRDMEYSMLDSLVKRCKTNGVTKIYGYYYKTEKNSMVENLYELLGFSRIDSKETDDSIWLMEVSGYNCAKDNIKIIEEEFNE